jgi:hypothetical protein
MWLLFPLSNGDSLFALEEKTSDITAVCGAGSSGGIEADQRGSYFQLRWSVAI